MMNVLLVYSAAKFKIENRIEFLGKDKKVETIEPGERVLAAGVYRFSRGIGVARVNAVNGSAVHGSGGDAQMIELSDTKSPWPDPGLMSKLTSTLGVTRDDLIDFLGGSGDTTKL